MLMAFLCLVQIDFRPTFRSQSFCLQIAKHTHIFGINHWPLISQKTLSQHLAYAGMVKSAYNSPYAHIYFIAFNPKTVLNPPTTCVIH